MAEKNDWFGKFDPNLLAFNKASAALKGRGLFRTLCFMGEEESFETCARMEAEFLFENGLTQSKELADEKDNKTSGVFVRILSDAAQYDRFREERGYLICKNFIPDGAQANVFSLCGFCKYSFFHSLKEVGLSFDETLARQLEETYGEKLTSTPKEVFLNNTLLEHYKRHGDENLHLDDFSWMENPIPQTQEAKEPKLFKEQSRRHAQTNTVTPKQSAQNKTQEAPQKNSSRKNRLQKTETLIPESLVTQPEKKLQQKTDEPSVSSEIIYEPDSWMENKEKTSEENRTGKSRETSFHYNMEALTPAQEQENLARREEMKARYEEVRDFIVGTPENQKFRRLITTLSNCLRKMDFSAQLCRDYLKITNEKGTDSPIYAKIYDLDFATQEYQKNLHHVYKECYCFNCESGWMQDITFYKGLSSVACPHCNNPVQFDSWDVGTTIGDCNITDNGGQQKSN